LGTEASDSEVRDIVAGSHRRHRALDELRPCAIAAIPVGAATLVC